jgi:GNAT superfamily N-acetyltransferase
MIKKLTETMAEIEGKSPRPTTLVTIEEVRSGESNVASPRRPRRTSATSGRELTAMCSRLELVTGRVLRPSAPDDAPRLVAMFERCSPASRCGRFLAPVRYFPASHLVDVVRSSPIRRSWVIDDLDTGRVVGVGSWFRNAETTAELGLLIEDAGQRRRLGTQLLDELAASARRAGVTTLVGHTLVESRHVHRMLRRLGPTTMERSGPVCTLRVLLTDEVDALAG